MKQQEKGLKIIVALVSACVLLGTIISVYAYKVEKNWSTQLATFIDEAKEYLEPALSAKDFDEVSAYFASPEAVQSLRHLEELYEKRTAYFNSKKILVNKFKWDRFGYAELKDWDIFSRGGNSPGRQWTEEEKEVLYASIMEKVTAAYRKYDVFVRMLRFNNTGILPPYENVAVQ